MVNVCLRFVFCVKGSIYDRLLDCTFDYFALPLLFNAHRVLKLVLSSQ